MRTSCSVALSCARSDAQPTLRARAARRSPRARARRVRAAQLRSPAPAAATATRWRCPRCSAGAGGRPTPRRRPRSRTRRAAVCAHGAALDDGSIFISFDERRRVQPISGAGARETREREREPARGRGAMGSSASACAAARARRHRAARGAQAVGGCSRRAGARTLVSHSLRLCGVAREKIGSLSREDGRNHVASTGSKLAP